MAQSCDFVTFIRSNCSSQVIKFHSEYRNCKLILPFDFDHRNKNIFFAKAQMIYIIKDKLYNAINHQTEPTLRKRGYLLLLYVKNCLVLEMKILWSVLKHYKNKHENRLSNYVVSLKRRQRTALCKLEICRHYENEKSKWTVY